MGAKGLTQGELAIFLTRPELESSLKSLLGSTLFNFVINYPLLLLEYLHLSETRGFCCQKQFFPDLKLQPDPLVTLDEHPSSRE